MAIVASDIHGNLDKAIKFLSYKPRETHIFAGDILDSFDKSIPEQIACINLLLNSKCKLIWGNHELHYLKEPPFVCSGRNYDTLQLVQDLLERNKDRFNNALEADGYLITHAGLSIERVELTKLKDVVKEINGNDPWIYQIGRCRGGMHKCGGIFWYDYIRDIYPLDKRFNQVFGHTASLNVWEDKNDLYHHVCINTRDTAEDFYIFDTKRKEVTKLI